MLPGGQVPPGERDALAPSRSFGRSVLSDKAGAGSVVCKAAEGTLRVSFFEIRDAKFETRFGLLVRPGGRNG